MYNKVLKNCSHETAPPLLPEKEVVRRYMYWRFGGISSLSDPSPRPKSSSEPANNFRYICPPPESLKIKSKVRNIDYNATGSRLYISTRDSVYLLNTQSMFLEYSFPVKSVTLIAHPKAPDIFALLIQPCVKVLELRNKHSRVLRPELVTLCTVTSAFDEPWYAGCWSLDGKYIALIDREDVLQLVEFGETYEDKQLDAEASVKLESEAYGLIFTAEHLVVYRVDGDLQIFSPDLKESSVEAGHSNMITAAAFCKNTNMMATGGSDHLVNVYDAADEMACLGSFPRLEGQISSLSFSHDGLLLAWGTKDSAPAPTEDGANLQSSLDSTASGAQEGEESNPPEYYLTVAGVDPCEIYYQHNTPSAVTHVAFSPNRYVIAYACDYESFPKGGAAHHSNVVGFLCL